MQWDEAASKQVFPLVGCIHINKSQNYNSEWSRKGYVQHATVYINFNKLKI